MITLTIDNQEVQVPEETTVLKAAEQVGIQIPTLCYKDGYKPTTSCMVCVVQVEGIKSLVPACGTRVAESMVVYTNTPHIQQARKTAIELLLSDHVGDCEAPCEIGCPANMDIPRMIRQIASDDFDAAIKTVKADIPLPAVCGRICPAPCEKVCRRKQADAAVSICLLKRFVADTDLAKDPPYKPECAPLTGQKVAIVGAGPAGLSAGYYLKQAGINCTIYDIHEYPGGALRYADIDRAVLPIEVVEKEIFQIIRLGVDFKGNIRIDKDVSIDELKSENDAVLLATGTPQGEPVKVNRANYETSEKGVFAAGSCIGSRNLCIRAVADGKKAAASIRSYLFDDGNIPKPDYNHRMGRLSQAELDIFMENASAAPRIKTDSTKTGFESGQARQEAARCLRCDCRKADHCQLRDHATAFQARQKTFQGEKKLFELITGHEQIVYEPGKCIQCGLCVQVAKKQDEPIGLSFQGRGFETRITVPLNLSIVRGLEKAAIHCVKICPTGALALKYTL